MLLMYQTNLSKNCEKDPQWCSSTIGIVTGGKDQWRIAFCDKDSGIASTIGDVFIITADWVVLQ